MLPETDDKFLIKAIGSIGGGNKYLGESDFKITKDSKLAQNLLFDQISRHVNLSMISKDLDALVNYEGTEQGFTYLVNDSNC